MKIFSLFLALVFATLAFPCASQSVAEQQDAVVIENLRAAGSDLTKVHDIDFFLYFASKPQAKEAAKEMKQLGYTAVTLEKSPDKSQWSVQAKRSMIPQLEAMTASTRSLEKLASRHGGEYDGWGTSIVK